MNQPCDCCGGPHVSTPAAVFNRPGLCKLAYRAGTYGTFHETMQARMSSADFPALAWLKTREPSDPSMALIDAWAVVGDILTFYQERIANEGYLRTATERRSVLELARLVGYALRPGVAASVYLAYLLEKDAAPVEIAKGAKSNSIPAPGEQMQAFETSDALPARVEWNMLKPRLTAPLLAWPGAGDSFYLKGIATGLKPNDPLLIGVPCPEEWKLHFVAAVEPDSDNDRTRIVLRTMPAVKVADVTVAQFLAKNSWATAADYDRTRVVVVPTDDGVPCPEQGVIPCEQMVSHRIELLADIVGALGKAPSLQPAGARQLPRSADAALVKNAETVPHLLAAMQPALSDTLYSAWKNVPPASASTLQIHALRIEARPFGYNAPLRLVSFDSSDGHSVLDEWTIQNSWNLPPRSTSPAMDHHDPLRLLLDNDYDIAPDSFVVIQKQGQSQAIVTKSPALIHRATTAYGLSGKTVEVGLPADRAWLSTRDESFSSVRNTRVFAGSENLELAEAPVTDDVAGPEIELDGLYDGLQAGRWVIVTGERSDVGAVEATDAIVDESTDAPIVTPGRAAVPGVAGVKAAELVMIAAVTQRTRFGDCCPLPGEKVHTYITLAKALAYRYRRETVLIYGNVVEATNGETRLETLGAGDATKAFQAFDLKQAPLTFVSAPTVSGVETTLQVRVNDVQWRESEAVASLGPRDRRFITRTDGNDKTSIVFGDGVNGARPPTGLENIRATYRNGIGKSGNVKAGQIALLNTRPLGVKDVINPIRASGGADRENLSQARRNTPLALLALDRLVSTKDYADFSRTFAGIGKAAARRTTDGRRQLVEVTIAGMEDIPIETTSDLYRNLYDALHRFGDPYLPIRLVVRRRAALVVAANVRVDPDYQWETLEPKIRAAMLKRFGFEKLELGEAVLLSDAIATIQNMPGVVYVDVDVFDKVSDEALLDQFTGKDAVTLGRSDCIGVAVDQIAYLEPEVPDTLILQEVK